MIHKEWPVGSWLPAAFGEEPTQDIGRLCPERADAFLASLSEETKVRRRVHAKICDAERDNLLHPRAGVEHARQKRVIAAALGRGPVDRREHRLDLGELQVDSTRTRARAFEGHGEDTLTVLDTVGVLCGTESKKA